MYRIKYFKGDDKEMSKALFKVMSKSTGYVYSVYKVNNTFNLYKIYNYFLHE